jgi:hypothetical protein
MLLYDRLAKVETDERLANEKRWTRVEKDQLIHELVKDDATIDELCKFGTKTLSPGYDAATLMTAVFLYKNDSFTQSSVSSVMPNVLSIVNGDNTLTGADFGDLDEVCVFTDIALKNHNEQPSGDIDDKFALCLLANVAQYTKLKRIVVVLSARKKSADDATTPYDVMGLLGTKLQMMIRTNPGTPYATQSPHISAEYERRTRSVIRVDVCYDFGVSLSRQTPIEVRDYLRSEFHNIITPMFPNAVAVVIGPISKYTASLVNYLNEGGQLKRVAGVSVSGGVNGGESRPKGWDTHFDADSWNDACKGGQSLRNFTHLTEYDTRKMTMTYGFLVKHNMAGADELKQAHASTWRNYVGFFPHAKSADDIKTAFRVLASNGQTTSELGVDAATFVMRSVYERFNDENPYDVSDGLYYQLTTMRSSPHPPYLTMAKRYVLWCFANLYGICVQMRGGEYDSELKELLTDGRYERMATVARMINCIVQLTDDKRVQETLNAVLNSISCTQVVHLVDRRSVYAMYVTSVMTMYMRLLSTGEAMHRIGLTRDNLTWCASLAFDGTHYLKNMNGDAFVSVSLNGSRSRLGGGSSIRKSRNNSSSIIRG